MVLCGWDPLANLNTTKLNQLDIPFALNLNTSDLYDSYFCLFIGVKCHFSTPEQVELDGAIRRLALKSNN